MYSLKHGVNLSRRACRNVGPQLLIVLWCFLLCLCSAEDLLTPPTSTNEPNTVVDTYRPIVPAEDVVRDGLYPGMKFGPMGPIDRDLISSNLLRQDEPSTDQSSTDVTTKQTSDDHHQHPVERYQVFKTDFERVETPFIIGLWIFCASIAKIGFHMTPKLSKIFPESCLLIVVGVVIGILLFHKSDNVHVSPLTPDTFFIYMLPPIILDAGYFMPNRLFFDHLGTILLFAVIGTIFNTVAIGASLWAVGQTDLFGCDIPLLHMFLFAALVSAVDPVAVLAVFEEIHVNEILYIVVFGESLLNDAVTVVLYHMFEKYSEMGPSNIIYTDILSGLGSFFVVALGGTVIGVLWGFATGFVTRFTYQVRVIEPIFIFVMAYLAYLNAEIFHMSGILAITFCGITMKNYVEANISHKSHTTIKYAMKMLSSSSETIIFMFLGVATVNKKHDWNTLFVALTIVFCSFFRVIGVIILTAIANRFRLHKLNKVEKFVMSYGGLRGAVAFALVLLIDPKHVPQQPMFMTTTIAVIYFTVFIQGITIKPLVKILNVKRAEKRKPTMNERIHERFMDHMMAGIEDILGQHGNYHVRDRFKRFDNKFIRPFLLRNVQGAEPKIIETYSKLTMKDAMEYMRRNASTIGNISGTESMSAIFRNYTAGNFNGSPSFSQLDSSTWNIDMQELEYNPCKKDLTDAKIHHLLSEELCKPRRHRRLSYSRHAVNDRDLSTQVNYRMHMNIRRFVGERRHHHKRSKKLGKDGKQNHVSFPEFQQNGTAKQFTHDYINEVLHETDDVDLKEIKEEWDSPITFTAKSSPSDDAPISTSITECNGSLNKSLGSDTTIAKPTAAEVILPWRRNKSNLSNYADESLYSESSKRFSRESDVGADVIRVTTPTATETMLPWKRDDDDGNTAAVQQNEFPAWASNKEYLAYNSPSATFLGGIENPRSSVIGLFRRESTGSAHLSSCDSSPRYERRGSAGLNAVILIEDGASDPLGVIRAQQQQQPTAIASSSATSTAPPPPGVVIQPTTPNTRRQVRRGSMLELTGSITHDTIPEECSRMMARKHSMASYTGDNRRAVLARPTLLRCTPRPPVRRQQTMGAALLSSSESDNDEDLLMKAGF